MNNKEILKVGISYLLKFKIGFGDEIIKEIKVIRVTQSAYEILWIEKNQREWIPKEDFIEEFPRESKYEIFERLTK